MTDDALYYYVCDVCGNIADVAAKPHGDEHWICEYAQHDDDDDDDDDHGPSTLSEFHDSDAAFAYSVKTSNLRHAAQMAKLDQSIANADEMRGKP